MAGLVGTSVRGLDAVAEALREEGVPIDKQGVAYAVGDAEVEDGRGGWVCVRDALDSVPVDRFDSVDEAVEALRAAARRTGGEGC